MNQKIFENMNEHSTNLSYQISIMQDLEKLNLKKELINLANNFHGMKFGLVTMKEKLI
jgi:hypothetical protein